jgi:hypothetical protein
MRTPSCFERARSSSQRGSYNSYVTESIILKLKALEEDLNYLGKPSTMRSYDSDISRLRIRVVNWHILFDTKLQQAIRGGCGPWILPNVLSIDNMFSDLEWGTHGKIKTSVILGSGNERWER